MLKTPKTLILLVSMVFVSTASAETYRVPATKDTVTLGLFTLDKQPVVKVHSGDSVSLET
ncbi:hypothetical protein [Legionella longbeachae]|nr:hypothetical protein [Legionella longbeachae]EEZ96675.1 conserved hypothetical protein [Legionella longbeachae D-4968]VEE00857.1 Uncharacterised protein [Legionella oakridgensis]